MQKILFWSRCKPTLQSIEDLKNWWGKFLTCTGDPAWSCCNAVVEIPPGLLKYLVYSERTHHAPELARSQRHHSLHNQHAAEPPSGGAANWGRHAMPRHATSRVTRTNTSMQQTSLRMLAGRRRDGFFGPNSLKISANSSL